MQAAWRFLNNENVSTDALFEPIFDTLKTEVEKQCKQFVLAMTDWSQRFYSTYNDTISLETTHLEELSQRALWIEQNLQTDKKIVHIVDESLRVWWPV